MRNLITICSLAAALYLGWQYSQASADRTAAEARARQAGEEIESLKVQLKTANARIAQAGAATHPQPGQPAAQSSPQPAQKPNWVDEKNRNWQSPLGSGSNASSKGRNPSAAPTHAAFPPQPVKYYTDSQGRYWLDAGGTKHYVP